MSAEPSLGTVNALLAELKEQTASGFRAVNDRLDRMDDRYVHKDVYESERDGTRDDVAELKESRVWLRRSLAGGLIALIAGFGGNFAYQVAKASPSSATSHVTTGARP